MSGSVHIWGFFDDDGGRRLPDGGAPSDLGVYDHFTVVRRNILHFGGELVEIRTTRTLGGFMVGIEFESPRRVNGKAAHMWHVIAEPREPWRDPTSPPAAPTAPTPEPEPVPSGAAVVESGSESA